MLAPPAEQHVTHGTATAAGMAQKSEAGIGIAADDQTQLAALIEQERETLLARWRQEVHELPSASPLDAETLNEHVTGFLDDLIAALRGNPDGSLPAAANTSAPSAQRLQWIRDGSSIEEVVAQCAILRGCIHDLAADYGLVLQGSTFHTVNRVFAHKLGSAAQAFSNQHAREAQARREEYLAFVAHDLRNPLSAISMACDVLQLIHPAQSTDPKTTQLLESMCRNVRQIEAMVSKVMKENINLQPGRGIKLERRELDLWPLVEALIHDLQPVAGTDSTTLVNNVPGDLVVFADAELLRRIFQNLIANAIRFTPQGNIIVGAIADDTKDAVECWVCDNGTGIPKALIGKVFDKGEHCPGKAGGTGLGLAIVKTFVEAHGGAATVDSKEGVGTTFRFSLPAKQEEHPPANVFKGTTYH